MKVVGALIILLAVFPFTVSVSAGPDATTDALPMLQTGRADEALHALHSEIQNNPNDARAYNLMGRVYFQLEHWDDAIGAAEKSVALASADSEYHQWLARAYGKKAEVAGAVSAIGLVHRVKGEFEKAVALDPAGKNLSARVDLAEFYIEAPYILGGDKTKARHLADFVMNLDPALGDSIRGRLDEKQNAKNRAEEDFKAAIQASGNLASYWVDLAAFYRRSGHLEEMEAAITKSLNAPRKDPIALFDGATVLLAAGRNFPEAIRMFQQYLSMADPAEDGPAFRAHYLLGLLREKQGEFKAAADEYRAALALASDYRPAQEALARINR